MKISVVLTSMGLLAAAAGLAAPALQQTVTSATPVSASAPGQPAAPQLAEQPLPAVSAETLRNIAAAAGGDVKAEDVRATPMPGIFELRQGSQIIYMSQTAATCSPAIYTASPISSI